MPRRYAEGTKVPVETSQGQIKRLVTSHGASGFLIAEAFDDEKEQLVGILQFAINHRMVRFERKYPDSDSELPPVRKARSEAQFESACEAEWRRRWRGLYLIIKAKLEMIEAGDTTVEREFMPDIMLPDGSTVGSHIQPKLEHAYATGKMPKLLPGGK